MYILNHSINFPPVSDANEDGLLAVGGDLSIPRLLNAYHNGVFPWYDEDQPILWFSPDPRMVLFPEDLKISKSMRQLFRKNYFEITFNKDFKQVIDSCASISRPDQFGTWITSDMQEAYIQLHEMGHAISVEVWKDKIMVGGLYGIWMKDKKVFCGESMFSKVSNASKYGFIKLVERLREKEVKLIDCQVYTDHLASLGAKEISRDAFMEFLK
ncbi:leucyl/phenylalanyl-tRNA--protein transferase [Aquimarina sp. BL5]|uniref:leucyl/phenylalanyl-tRNA--protein transferase n=1 Tax=Aquimarina sp. BL5 TaxID=1714860 RepID=UPI000E4C9D15|nr:leucyl/phenylalanyl-tRNA--protein transferase [Aquimarina sp. BL5]AXT52295.1 leucyl/phenylalanyl-tRNA--protein transferase [Aquimarina sp. BL5]RKN09967.1 leucyl/phenylalanyl-tRNA--protein transferase [Aquimarina sp. BL5]